MNLKRLLLSFFAAVIALPVLAETRPAPSGGPDRVLSDHWYTITLAKEPYGYYNDRVEVRKGRLFYQNHVWKREEGAIVEEQLGTYSENNAALSPLFFNYHSTYRATEITIDGTVSGRTELTVKARRGSEDLPVIKRGISTRAFFSVVFPYWLGKVGPKLKTGQSESFLAVVEDNIDQGRAMLDGRVKADKEPGKFQVNYRGFDSYWWLDKNGVADRIEMPAQKMQVRRVSGAEEARRFLDGN
ncbi:MAG: hypothetical protein NDJ89_00825 [Oligoflexia bacterium]|nr:hypothetical protein [Oligoflexia bacterium]